MVRDVVCGGGRNVNIIGTAMLIVPSKRDSFQVTAIGGTIGRD